MPAAVEDTIAYEYLKYVIAEVAEVIFEVVQWGLMKGNWMKLIRRKKP